MLRVNNQSQEKEHPDRVAGKASLPPGPLRTVLATLTAHGSSKPLTQPFPCWLTRSHLACDLLMTGEVHEPQIAIAVRTPAYPRFNVVGLGLSLVEEAFPTHWADILLAAGYLLVAGRQFVGLRRLSCRPVFPQSWVVG